MIFGVKAEKYRIKSNKGNTNRPMQLKAAIGLDVVVNMVSDLPRGIKLLSHNQNYVARWIKEPIMNYELKETTEIEKFISEHKHSNASLGEILNIDPASYQNAYISEVGFNNAGLALFQRYKGCEDYPISELLRLTVDEMSKIRNLGERGLIYILKTLHTFFDNYEVRYFPHESVYEGDINIYRLDRALRNLMCGEQVDDIKFREDELPYVEKYKEATSVIDRFICEKAYRNDAYIIELANSLFKASNDLALCVEYKQQLEETFYKIPSDIRNRRMRPFVKAYHLKNENLQYEYFMSFDSTLTIQDVYHEVRKYYTVSYSLYMGLMSFFEWLNFDIDEIAEEILTPLKANMLDRIIFADRAHGLKQGDAFEKYDITGSKLYCLECRIARVFYKAHMNCKYDIFAMLYAMRDNVFHKVDIDDMRTAIGDENAELIWYAVKRLKNYYRTGLYSYRGHREVLGDRVTMGIWFFD